MAKISAREARRDKFPGFVDRETRKSRKIRRPKRAEANLGGVWRWIYGLCGIDDGIKWKYNVVFSEQYKAFQNSLFFAIRLKGGKI